MTLIQAVIVYSLLCKDLSEDDIAQAKADSDACIHGTYFYIDKSYDRISLCANIDKVLEYLKNEE